MNDFDLLLPAESARNISGWATVTQASPLRVQLDGDSSPLGFTPDSLVSGLDVDDRVWVDLATNNDPAFTARRLVVVGKSGGTLASVANDSITNALLANMATQTIKGRNTAGTGDPEDLTVSQVKSLLGITSLESAITALQDATTERPICHIYATANQSVSNSTATAINMPGELVDTHGGHSTSSNTSRYTAQVAGWYLISGYIGWAAHATGRRVTFWYKNGSALANGQANTPATASGSGGSIARAMLVQLAVNDYIELYGYQESGGALNANAADAQVPSNMTVIFIRPN